MTYQYLCRETLKATIQIPDPADDSDIDTAIRTATAVIDKITGRRFQPYLAVRTFDAPPLTDDDYHDRASMYDRRKLLLHEDILEVTTFKTDDGTRSYPYTWPSGTWDVGPEDALYRNPPQAYEWIRRVPIATAIYGWPTGIPGGVQIEGKWGFYDQRRASRATITADIDDAVLAIPVSDVSLFAIGHTILVGAEQIYVTAKTTGGAGTLTVEGRGGNGTVPVSHASGAPIQIYCYPIVDQAADFLCARYFRQMKDAPLGIIGGAEGFMRLAISEPGAAGLLAGLSLTAMR